MNENRSPSGRKYGHHDITLRGKGGQSSPLHLVDSIHPLHSGPGVPLPGKPFLASLTRVIPPVKHVHSSVNLTSVSQPGCNFTL